MSGSARVVPWADWDEWGLLRSQLALRDVAAFSATLAVYRARRAATLPQHVESTAALVGLLCGGGDAHARRLALAMALVRLVNGSTDALQPRGADSSARPVAALARQLGLPQTLVDVRHAAAHNALPRLDALEDAARDALVWLDQVYWTPQAAAAGLPADPLAPPLPSPSPLGSSPPEVDASAETSGTPKRKSRWAVSGAPEDWKGVPIGVLPGQESFDSLLGVDLSTFVGRRWTPHGVAQDPEENTGDLHSTKVVEDVESAQGAKARESQEPDPVRKRSRVLSGPEKTELVRLMREMDAEPPSG